MTSGGFRSRVVVGALVAVVASMSLSIVATVAGAASRPTLVVYSAQGYDKATVAAFNATHPGFSVTLARALAADVGLILFDEPLSNLDADRREQLRIEIATLTREAGASAVYITHDQSEAFALADQVGVLDKGGLVQLDTPETIYRRPATAFVARFTGVSGEFPIKVVDENRPGYYEVALPFAPDQRIEAMALERFEPGDEMSLFVRAAGVSLMPARSPLGVEGLVRDVAFNGRGYEHVVSVSEDAELNRVFSPTRFDRESAVKVCFDASSCFVMDPRK